MEIAAKISYLAIVTLCLVPSSSAQRSKSEGPVLLIATTHTCATAGRSRDIVVRMQTDGGFRINEEHVKPEDLSARLREIFQSRVRRCLYVTADRNIPLKNVLDLVNELSNDFENFAILTPSVEQRLVNDRSLCLGPGVPSLYKAPAVGR